MNSIPLIVSLEIDLSTSTEIRTVKRKSPNGLVTHLTVKISQALIRMMVARNQLLRDESPGGEVIASASIHFFDGDDRKPTGAQSAFGVAI